VYARFDSFILASRTKARRENSAARSLWLCHLLAPSDRSGRGVRPTSAVRTQQRDTERDPGALEHEQANVVDAVLDGDGDKDARGSDDRQHLSAPEGVAEPGRDEQMTDEEQ
jgi:hypothetical protein